MMRRGRPPAAACPGQSLFNMIDTLQHKSASTASWKDPWRRCHQKVERRESTISRSRRAEDRVAWLGHRVRAASPPDKVKRKTLKFQAVHFSSCTTPGQSTRCGMSARVDVKHTTFNSGNTYSMWEFESLRIIVDCLVNRLEGRRVSRESR